MLFKTDPELDTHLAMGTHRTDNVTKLNGQRHLSDTWVAQTENKNIFKHIFTLEWLTVRLQNGLPCTVASNYGSTVV